MYIEFVGIPGAGKTTLVDEVRKLLERDGIKCATRTMFFPKNMTWKYKLLWMLLHPQYLDLPIAKLLFKLSRVQGSTFESLVTRLHEHQKLQYQLAYHEGSVVLWDAGHVQRLSNLARRHILSNVAVTRLICERLPRKSFLILVETPVGESIARMKEREPSRGVDGLQELQDQTQQAQQDIFASLATKGIATARIDGTKSLTENAAIVCGHIKKKL